MAAVEFLLGKFRLASYGVECIVSLAQCIILRGLGVNVIYENTSFEHNPVKLSKKNMPTSRIKQFYKKNDIGR